MDFVLNRQRHTSASAMDSRGPQTTADPWSPATKSGQSSKAASSGTTTETSQHPAGDHGPVLDVPVDVAGLRVQPIIREVRKTRWPGRTVSLDGRARTSPSVQSDEDGEAAFHHGVNDGDGGDGNGDNAENTGTLESNAEAGADTGADTGVLSQEAGDRGGQGHGLGTAKTRYGRLCRLGRFLCQLRPSAPHEIEKPVHKVPETRSRGVQAGKLRVTATATTTMTTTTGTTICATCAHAQETEPASSQNDQIPEWSRATKRDDTKASRDRSFSLSWNPYNLPTPSFEPLTLDGELLETILTAGKEVTAGMEGHAKEGAASSLASVPGEAVPTMLGQGHSSAWKVSRVSWPLFSAQAVSGLGIGAEGQAKERGSADSAVAMELLVLAASKAKQ